MLSMSLFCVRAKCVYSLQITQFSPIWYPHSHTYCVSNFAFLLERCTLAIGSCTVESFAVLILVLKISEIPQRCSKHICSPSQGEIMRLLKNRTREERKVGIKEEIPLRHPRLVCMYCRGKQPWQCREVCRADGYWSKQKVLSGTSGHAHRLLALGAHSY